MEKGSSINHLGLVQALLACLFWGVMPIYFKLLQDVAPLEVVAHRVIWSVPLLLLILWLRKNMSGLRAAISNPATFGLLLLSALMIALNWGIYVWAVQEDHILAASLGYFISPLLNIVLAMLFLKERLNRAQWIAVAIAAIGVSILAVQAWQTLWISLALSGSWGLYALIRKIADVGPVVGLTVETSVIFPVCIGYLLLVTASPDLVRFGHKLPIDLLLMGGALVTAAPLILFAAAVKKMRLSAIGILQYLAPTLQFLIGTLIYKEPLTTSHLVCFLLIWISLAIFSGDSIASERKRRALQATS